MIKTENLRFIIFEGGDFVGKSTQATNVAIELKNSVVIHFPRRNDNAIINNIYEKMADTVFDDYFVKNKVSNNVYDKDMKQFIDNCSMNIIVNQLDKLNFLEENTFISRLFPDSYDKLMKDAVYYFEGNPVNSGNYVKFLKNLNEIDKFYVILDRFALSGYVYNYNAPKQAVLSNGSVSAISDRDYIFNNSKLSESKKHLLDIYNKFNKLIKCSTKDRLSDKVLTILMTPSNFMESRKETTKRAMDKYDKSQILSKATADEYRIIADPSATIRQYQEIEVIDIDKIVSNFEKFEIMPEKNQNLKVKSEITINILKIVKRYEKRYTN